MPDPPPTKKKEDRKRGGTSADEQPPEPSEPRTYLNTDKYTWNAPRASPPKKMCVVSSGRVGAMHHQPANFFTQLQGCAALRDEMNSFCATLDVTLDWASFDDDELRGLDAPLLQSMGVGATLAARIIAKLRGTQSSRHRGRPGAPPSDCAGSAEPT